MTVKIGGLTDEEYYDGVNYYAGIAYNVVDLTLPKELTAAIEGAVDARSKIPLLQEEMKDLLKDSENDIERAAREYQIDLIEWQLTRAADLAEERYSYIKAINSASKAQAELARIDKDLEHYYRMYCWGFDPRPDSPLAVIPFELFEFQKRFIKWLDNLVFTRRSSGVVEKARDMGATESALRWSIHRWRFMPGFSALLLSANDDLVDSLKNENTLFGKVRFQMRLFPRWFLPQGFNVDKDMPTRNITHAALNSALHGYAPTADVGRQSRATVVLMDEYAVWPQGGIPQHTALGSTSKSLIAISSAQGKGNKFSDLCHDNITPKFVMDWREHPFKDERWYQALPFGYIQASMTDVQIAQEIDRNFEASQPGRVFTNLKEEYCFITWDELIDFYAQHKLDKEFINSEGLVQIPKDFEWGRNFDWGQTPGHPWTYSILARPPEDWPLQDSVFLFCCQRMPWDGTTEQQFVAQHRYLERTLGLRNDKDKFLTYPQYSECSHEQEDLRDTLLQIYGESWTAWDTDYQSGLSQLREWFGRIDQHKPNPFRPQLMGRSTIYFVAPKGSYQCAFNEQSGSHFVTPSESEWAFKLLREELQEYHYAPEERFKPLPQQRPVKKKDDCIDTLRGHATLWGAISKPLTAKQKYNKRLKAMLPPPLAKQYEAGGIEMAPSVPGEIAPDITFQMNEMFLKREMRKEGEFVRDSPFEDDDGDEFSDMSGGW